MRLFFFIYLKYKILFVTLSLEKYRFNNEHKEK